MFKFFPLHNSWVALNPSPVGVIFFIGGAFFGSFPTVFYRGLLRYFHDQGYTVVAIPFRFSFDHWNEAINIIHQQPEIQYELQQVAVKLGFDDNLYRKDLDESDSSNLWVGHSIGCKYVALLELLSSSPPEISESLRRCSFQPKQLEKILELVTNESIMPRFIFNQPSLQIDPVISDLDDAIPFGLAGFFRKLGLFVQPDRGQTFCLIRESRLFNLTSILYLSSSTAKQTVDQLVKLLQDRMLPLATINPSGLQPLGKHLAPVRLGRPGSKLLEVIQSQLNSLSSKISRVREKASLD